MRVMKFGGTSVSDVDKIMSIAQYVKDQLVDGEKLVIVASAMNKQTDELIDLASKISITPNKRELDRLLSIGEQQTISLLAMSLHDIGVLSVSLTGDQLKIKTSGDYASGQIMEIDKGILIDRFVDHDVVIVAGFQGVNDDNDIVTLGRGGSDTTAVAIASVLGCNCEIYTDVCGIYTTDPRMFKTARKLDYITFDEMAELASLGASVMHNRSIFIAKKYNVCVYVAKSLSNTKGTWIMNEMIESNVVTAIAVDNDVVNVIVKTNGTRYGILNDLTEKQINLDMVSQVVYENKYVVGFSTSKDKLQEVELIVKTIAANDNVEYEVNTELTKISLVGSAMRDSSGVIARVFNVLYDNDIEVVQTTTSEITISVLVDKNNAQRGLELLCSEFDLEVV